jgi:membrane-bound lytic murein transglycosylase B
VIEERSFPWFGLSIGCCVVIAVILGAVNASSSGPVPETEPAQQPIRVPQVQPPAPLPSPTSDAPSPLDRVDPSWAASVAASTGIPERALLAYAFADLALAAEQPECGVGWNTLAALGWIESGHGFHDGSVLGADGYVTPVILGPRLDGGDVEAIADTDSGFWDRDTEWDRAVGPLQFIPSTWATWGADGSGDGVIDPNQIDDAALTAGRYLCASGSLRDAEGWRAAILSYNRIDAYVESVAEAANYYAARAG